MSSEKVCGIKVSGKKDGECCVAFLYDNSLTVFSSSDDKFIVDKIVDERPSVIVFTNPAEVPKEEGFRESEEDLVEEGYSFLPRDMFGRGVIERSVFLANSVKQKYQPEVISCRPRISSEALDVSDDSDLKDLGLKVEKVESMEEFEAVVAALTGEKYLDNSFVNKGFIIPKKE